MGDAMDRLPAARRFVRRFVAGPALEDALGVAARLNADGVDAAITHLGENVVTIADASRAADAYLEVLDETARRRLRAVPSLKLTHLGLDLGNDVCRANLERVAARGFTARTLVWIDMESSAYTDRTLDLYGRLHPTYSNLACVVQSYLRRTEQDVEGLIEIGATVRLCKGAYREPPQLAFPDKRDVDLSYARSLDRLLSADALARGVYPAFATHDERLIGRAREQARAGGVAADRYEVQMLYGIRHDMHAPLRSAGLRLRVLVPYGEDWYGYFMRRLAERPANLAFFFRQVFRG
jgi:proline dehydrogenase